MPPADSYAAPLFLFSFVRHPPSPTLFPYTTLFRSSSAFGAETAAPAQVEHEGVPLKAAPIVEIGKFAITNSMLVTWIDRKSTRLNSSHTVISYAVFCLKKKKTIE